MQDIRFFKQIKKRVRARMLHSFFRWPLASENLIGTINLTTEKDILAGAFFLCSVMYSPPFTKGREGSLLQYSLFF